MGTYRSWSDRLAGRIEIDVLRLQAEQHASYEYAKVRRESLDALDALDCSGRFQ